MPFDPEREAKKVDVLIERVELARRDAVAHGSVVLIDIHDEKLCELRKLRELLVPKQREPEE